MVHVTDNGLQLIEWGAATRTLPGQSVSGDLPLVSCFRNGALVAVVDGLGHGDEAAAAAKTATLTLADNPAEPVIWLVKRCHEALAGTRGVVMTLASFNAEKGTMTWVGVGNVEGVLVRADSKAIPPAERVLLRGGVLGYQLPPLLASVVSVNVGDTLLLASDGVRPSFAERLSSSGETPQCLADRIMATHYKGMDDALVLAARYRSPRHE